MDFLSIRETKEVVEFYYNSNNFDTTDKALSAFTNFMFYLSPELKGFKENDVKATIKRAINDPMLYIRRARGKRLFSCHYDHELTIEIHRTNDFFKKGTIFPSQFLLRSTPFKSEAPEYNSAQHGKNYIPTEYIISDSLHFITYPDKSQEIIYFD